MDPISNALNTVFALSDEAQKELYYRLKADIVTNI